MLARAWCILQENEDIVRWVACLVWGSSTADTLVAKLEGRAPRVEVFCHSEESLGGVCGHANADAFHDFFGGRIRICTTSKRLSRLIKLDDRGGSEALCAAVDLATLIAHEVAHIAIGGLWTLWDVEDVPCRETKMFHNTLRWALLQRLSEALDALCCRISIDVNGFGDGLGNVRADMFMFDDSMLPLDPDTACTS